MMGAVMSSTAWVGRESRHPPGCLSKSGPSGLQKCLRAGWMEHIGVTQVLIFKTRLDLSLPWASCLLKRLITFHPDPSLSA